MSNISRSAGSNRNSANQSCVVCKHQRRKCAPDCILAPYFPHDRRRQFLNVHKLFGVRNITKIIKNLNPPEKDNAMKTIVLESTLRANDPVGGIYRIIQELQCGIEYREAELELVLHQLAACRAQVAQQQQQQQQQQRRQQQQQSHLQMQEPESCSSSSSCKIVNHPDILN